MTSHYLMVGLGGALGSILRLFFTKLLPLSIWGVPFPILFVNILGCFVMGLLIEFMALIYPVSENLRYFLTSGLLGGFTTFSAFALEFGLLYDKNQLLSSIIYAGLSIGLSITAFFCGIKLVKLLAA